MSTAATDRQPSIVAAAVDLGSNSFHMLIGRLVEQDLQVVDRIREPVCLAAGLDDEDRLSDEAQVRALECLERFGQRLRAIPQLHVRAVGTNTLRRALNSRAFRERAEEVLGHPIEVISGQEEARLVFLGVAHDQFSAEPRLVIDIGGGSTEVILGEGFELIRGHSLHMGCVGYTRGYFPEGQLKKEQFKRAEIGAALELRAIRKPLRGLGWTAALGSSGTIRAVGEILQANEWSDEGITLAGLKRLRKALIAAGEVDEIDLDGVRAERAGVLPGGLAILIAVFKTFDLETMTASPGALREGLLYDLVGRIRHEDVRDRTIRSLVRQYRADPEQGSRVERTALILLQRLCPEWRGDLLPRKLLVWASRLHEIGLAVSHSGFHKHGAYLIANSEMPGFSRDDQATLASLIRGHRRKLSDAVFDAVPSGGRDTAVQLCVVLRLAVLLNRSRTTGITPLIRADKGWKALALTFSPGWIDQHPLTHADLDREARYLRGLDIRLEYQETTTAKEPA